MSTVTFSSVTKRYPNGFEAVTGLDLDVADGELLVVVGPSGCGKTTTLRMLAGLESITEGAVLIGDDRVNNVAARNRDIAMVFQSYALYPHLSVAGNLAYPLKLAGMSRSDIKDRVGLVSRQLRLDDLLDRKPRQLSGGQRQRVAMGRAMVREPRVFLMDEPLSNLDAKLRVSMRAEVAELQGTLGTTMFYVTHDQIEAMTLGHRVAVMRDGVLQQCAPPIELYRNPANTFVATFIGAPPMNLLSGRFVVDGDDSPILETGTDRCGFVGDTRQLHRDRVSGQGDVVVGFRPEDVRLGPPNGAEPGLAGVIRLIEVLGSEQIVHLELPRAATHEPAGTHADDASTDGLGETAGRILAKITDHGFDGAVGDHVAVIIDADRIQLFDPHSGLALQNLVGAR